MRRMRASVAGGIFPESKLAPLPHGATGSAFSSMSTSWSAFQVEGLVLRSGLTCFRFRMLFSVSVSYRKHVNHTSRSSLPTIFPESKLAPLSHGATGSAFSSTSISYSAFRVWVITCLQLRMLFPRTEQIGWSILWIAGRVVCYTSATRYVSTPPLYHTMCAM